MRKTKITLFIFTIMALGANLASAQTNGLQYYRPEDQRGINMFEPPKNAEQPAFDTIKFHIGASFTQDFQSITHSNMPVYVAESATNPVNKNLLYGVNPAGDSTKATLTGFNTAMANLYLDLQLADGIRLNVESYLSTRHHPESWVKGGYIQVDKLPMLGNPSWFSKYLRVKIGEFQPDYGDMQFRRSDGGNCMYNPFIENYIMDAFTTEIGGEVFIFPFKGLTAVAGASSGQVEGNVTPYYAKTPQRDPSMHMKLAYDNTCGQVRYRVSASMYSNNGNVANTLYLGDRAGSHYSMVMEQARSLIFVNGIPTTIGPSTTTNNKDSGRQLPIFNNKVNSMMINYFLKYKGLELFGAYEMAKGRSDFELPGDRKFTQMAEELVYRFLPREQCYIGARYITVKGLPLFAKNDVTVNRLAIAAGWFPTRNLELKTEYVTQEYKDFTPYDYQYKGKFNGYVVEAIVSF